MLNDAFPYFEGEVQSAKGWVADLEILHNSQGMQIVVEEKPMPAHGRVQYFLSCVPKRRMPDIVNQSQSFHQVDVQSKLGCHRPRDLGNFQGLGQPVAEMVGVAAGENLCFGLKAAKSSRMNDAVTVALEVVPVRMLCFRMAAATRLFNMHGVVSQHGRKFSTEGPALSIWHEHLAGVDSRC